MLLMKMKMMNQTSNPWNLIQSPIEDVSARRIDHTHPLDLFWGKDGIGRYLFIFEFPGEIDISVNNIPEITGIQFEIYQNKQGKDLKRLVYLLKDKGDWEIFLALCNDIILSTRKANNAKLAIQSMVNRLRRWQDFLKKSRQEILSEEEIKGLIGELLFLIRYLVPSFGIEQAVRYWQGPEGLPQDYNVDNSVIEVKCRSGATPIINISSIEQLCSQLEDLFLFVVTLGKTAPEAESAINLPSLITKLREEINLNCPEAIDRFNDLIYLTGYIDSDRYLDFSYVLSKENMYQVTDAFPRICRKDLHPGIVKLTYSINLDECAPFEKYPDWISLKK